MNLQDTLLNESLAVYHATRKPKNLSRISHHLDHLDPNRYILVMRNPLYNVTSGVINGKYRYFVIWDYRGGKLSLDFIRSQKAKENRNFPIRTYKTRKEAEDENLKQLFPAVPILIKELILLDDIEKLYNEKALIAERRHKINEHLS